MSSLEPAVIWKLDKAGKNSGAPIKVMFRPKELNISKQNNWQATSSPQVNVPKCDFKGGGAETLKLQLFFDTYVEQADVRKKYTNAIYDLMKIDEQSRDKKTKKGRPPTVRFQWGDIVGFSAVITNISQRFSLFLPNGTPVRAVLDVSFQQFEEEVKNKKTNPTSGGVGGERHWLVRAGDTLAWIAFNEYGDSNQWRLIADANSLTQVRRLLTGTMLMIPNV
jgi:nucleoid-associated protein YgaU